MSSPLQNAIAHLEKRRATATQEISTIDATVNALRALSNGHATGNGGGNGQPPTNSNGGWMSTRQAGRALGISSSYVARFLREGTLQGRKIPGQGAGGEVWQVSRTSVQEFADR